MSFFPRYLLRNFRTKSYTRPTSDLFQSSRLLLTPPPLTRTGSTSRLTRTASREYQRQPRTTTCLHLLLPRHHTSRTISMGTSLLRPLLLPNTLFQINQVLLHTMIRPPTPRISTGSTRRPPPREHLLHQLQQPPPNLRSTLLAQGPNNASTPSDEGPWWTTFWTPFSPVDPRVTPPPDQISLHYQISLRNIKHANAISDKPFKFTPLCSCYSKLVSPFLSDSHHTLPKFLAHKNSLARKN